MVRFSSVLAVHFHSQRVKDMASLKEEIAAYETMRNDLETEHLFKWVVVHDKELVGIYEDFQKAAQEAVERFGRGPYLIRRVGESSVTLPASLLYPTV